MRALSKLIEYLRSEYENPPANFDNFNEFDTFRGLLNIREEKPISKDFITLQDEVLQEKIQQKGIVDISELVAIKENSYLWQGDITRLRVDAIVNAANSQMLGCFCPCHNCIDNVIHTFAGVQLRLECGKIMQQQGQPEPTGKAKITLGYNLPSKYVLHTVGPIIHENVTSKDTAQLASSYRSCLELAEENTVRSIALCCISTGEFHFPNELAAEIAIETVYTYRKETKSDMKVIFNVFTEYDKQIYTQLLNADIST